MEALPSIPMMAPQFRTSTLSYDNIPNFDFRMRMKEHILLTFSADPHEYDSAFDELSQLKYEANVPSPSVEQICKLKRYYGQLCMMQKRFPMGPGDALETPFAWNDGLLDRRSAGSEVTICDIEFEKASVMFNIGACHAHFAAEQPRDTQDSIKLAFMHFQYAAFAFEQLNSYRNSDMFYPSVDLDANVIAFHYKVLIAQAQECLVQKSLLDNRSPIVIAKLSLWLQEAFESAARIVDEWAINIPDSDQRYYAKLCHLKSDIYGVIAYMSMGDNSEKEEKKMGWRLQYYKIAMKYMDRLQMNIAKMRDRYPELLVTVSFLFDVITAKHKNAEKENDFIYHDRVPKEEEARDAVEKDGGAMCKVKTLSFDPLDPSVSGPDLFGRLLPSFIVESVQKYEKAKEELIGEMRELVKGYDDHLANQLRLAEFEKLRFMLAEGKNEEAWFEIGEELMKRNADMTAYPDCVPILIEKLRESQDTARVAEAKLNTLIAKLRAIDLPRIKSDEGYILISKELDRLAEHLAQAKANNLSLNKAIVQHSSNLQLLTLPCVEMWRKIVPGEEKKTNQVSAEEVQIRKMVEKILEMQSQRQKLLDQLAQELKADDISNKLMGTNERGAEEIMSAEIQKHSNTQQLIRLNVTAQDTILRAFTDANADFFEERSAMSSRKSEYDRKVSELCGSYEVYRDVKQKTEEGEQFYRQLMARCDQFAIPVHAMDEQYRAEMEKKMKAQKEAELHMNQLRMSREAQNAMMDFGGPGGPPPPRYAPPTSSTTRGPRLGDYLESYRARKMNNPPPTEFVPENGPPSPTPSSICGDYGRSVAPTRFAGPQGPQDYGRQYSGGSGASLGPQGPQDYGRSNTGTPILSQGPQPTFGGPQGPQDYGRSNTGTPQGHQAPQFGAPGPQGPQDYGRQHSATPLGSHGSQPAFGASQGPHPGAPGHHGPRGPQFGHQGPQGPHPGTPGHQGPQFGHQGPQGPQPGAPGHQGPPDYGRSISGTSLTSQGPQFGISPQPGPQGSHGGPPGFQGAQPTFGGPQDYGRSNSGAPGSQGSPIPPGYGGGPQPGYPGHQGPPSQGSQFGAPSQGAPWSQGGPQDYGRSNFGTPQGHQGPQPTFGGPQGAQDYGRSNSGPQGPPQGPPQRSPVPPTFGGPQDYGRSNSGPQGPQGSSIPPRGPQPVFQGPQGYGSGPTATSQAPSMPPGPPTTVPQWSQAPPPPPPLQPSYQPAPPQSQTVFQHPPQGPAISSPPPPATHQHVAPFQPTPAAPSPWHATPQQLKTPWNAPPQYHSAPAPAAQPTPPTQQQAPPPQATPTRSNVDLLSDLLGDFNLPPPIQPTVQNTQNLQHQAPPPPNPQAPPPTTRTTVIHNRPAAAVPPMPQLSQIAQQSAEATPETPILLKSASSTPSVTELSDPSKFELGEGNAQKLEKRMLHHSIRTNVAPPPLNPQDPLNQIDVFSFANRQK